MKYRGGVRHKAGALAVLMPDQAVRSWRRRHPFGGSFCRVVAVEVGLTQSVVTPGTSSHVRVYTLWPVEALSPGGDTLGLWGMTSDIGYEYFDIQSTFESQEWDRVRP